MGKDPNFIGQPILSQILSLIDKREIDLLAKKHSSDRYTKKFTTHSHLVTMLYCILHRCTSLREVTTGMQACYTKLNHIGMTYCPRRSTLSDANRRRSSEVFQEIYMTLYSKLGPRLSDSHKSSPIKSKLYIADSTTISLFKAILKTGGRKPSDGRRKGGMKVHALIKADHDVPCLVKMTAASEHDVKFIKGLQLPKGSIVTFDRGYVDLKQYDLWTQQEITWVTRFKTGVNYNVVDEFSLTEKQKKAGVISDDIITLGTKSRYRTQTDARLIVFYDPVQDKIFSFITNNFLFEPQVIAQIYKYRWQIELLFKRIKQNFPLKHFLGDNENALKVQVWCVLIADLLLKYIKSKLKKKWSYANLTSMVRLHLMSYFKLIQFLNNPDKSLINAPNKTKAQLNLFSSA